MPTISESTEEEKKIVSDLADSVTKSLMEFRAEMEKHDYSVFTHFHVVDNQAPHRGALHFSMSVNEYEHCLVYGMAEHLVSQQYIIDWLKMVLQLAESLAKCKTHVAVSELSKQDPEGYA